MYIYNCMYVHISLFVSNLKLTSFLRCGLLTLSICTKSLAEGKIGPNLREIGH